MTSRACPACQAANDPRRRYCGGCGTLLRAVCTRCGFDNEGSDRYCGLCGDGLLPIARAATPAPPPAPARTQWITDAELEELAAPKAGGDEPRMPSRFSQSDLDGLFEEVRE